ncbi:MAG TPA: sigma-54 dependent transcriptional regulator [Puia sp.]|nr:sigma-54 dependent transcriptional regulator [Puia sp.]
MITFDFYFEFSIYMPGNILIVDDEDKLRSLLSRIIRLEGYTVREASDLKTARKMLEKDSPDVILCDVKLPDGNGVDFVLETRTKYPSAEIILLTAYGNIADGVQAMKNGAFDYIIKGDDNEKVLPLLNRVIEKIQLTNRVAHLETQFKKNYDFNNILGESSQILEAVSLAKKVAATDATVLLMGETGTGKEVFAQAIHYAGKRSMNPFVALNCSTLNKELLESELFGHKEGSFTGATKEKKGLLEEANTGTLFLDEIGEMHIELQAKLLRVLETREYIKVGDTKTIKADVRIIAATNKLLLNEVNAGKFREDLYYRLNAFTIILPALRERKSDIPILARHFLKVYAEKTNPRVKSIGKDFQDSLKKHEWKGNIRELKNIIERSLIVSNDTELTAADLPMEFSTNDDKSNDLSALDLATVEKLHIQRVLSHTHNNKSETARLLNIGLSTLYRKMEEYNIP